MYVLLLRHGDAGEAHEWARTGRPDDERPLTKEGKKDVERVAAGIASLAPKVAAVVHSPLVRARQTAEIAAAGLGVEEMVVSAALRPERDPADIVRWLDGPDAPAAVHAADKETVCLVGHEPHLGLLASWLLAGGRRSFIVMKKAGACLLERPAGGGAGSARLAWSLPPRASTKLA